MMNLDIWKAKDEAKVSIFFNVSDSSCFVEREKFSCLSLGWYLQTSSVIWEYVAFKSDWLTEILLWIWVDREGSQGAKGRF